MEQQSDESLKQIQVIFSTKEQAEGVGAKVKRFIGVKQNPTLDPFLMLDMFRGRLPGGFPDHPHRGFETVSYLLEGVFYHEDFKGHKGKLEKGDIQWMTAGKGIVHSEMPGSFTEDSVGFQLWLNLDKTRKYCDPRYQEFKATQIPTFEDEKIKAKVIAGEVFGVKGPIEAVTPTYYLDFYLGNGKSYEHKIPAGWNSMIVVHHGAVTVQNSSQILKVGDCSVFKINEQVEETVRITSHNDNTGFLLLAGKPINEPIVWRGPFVLNTQKELEQTFYDYSHGVNGFEGADEWESEIKYLAYQKH